MAAALEPEEGPAITFTETEFFKHLDDRGRVKHGILKRYLDAYFPIMSRNPYKKYDKIIYIDGFAGAGNYLGEDGSPVLALRTGLYHKVLELNGPKIKMFFIEQNEVNYNKLKENVEIVINEANSIDVSRERFGNDNVISLNLTLKSNLIFCDVIKGDFSSSVKKIIQEELQDPNTPVLAFVDPFGFKCIPMETIKLLMNCSDKSEIFINVMYGFATRFLNADRTAAPINALFGTPNGEWRATLLPTDTVLTPAERRTRFMEYYIKQLSEGVGGIESLKFAIRRKGNNRYLYYLTFFTRHPKGIKKMKEAMWRKTQLETELVFSEFEAEKNNTELLQITDPKHELITNRIIELILQEFTGRKVLGKEINAYILHESIYLCEGNLIKLKAKLKEYISNAERAFDNIIFDFPSLV